MSTYAEQKAKAASWLYENRDRAQWWTWAVLTTYNSDPTSLKLSDTLASSIFVDLSARGLLVPVSANSSAGPMGAYALDLGREDDWKRVMNPPGPWRKFVVGPFVLVFKNFWRFTLWVASIAIAVLVTKYVESTYPHIGNQLGPAVESNVPAEQERPPSRESKQSTSAANTDTQLRPGK